MDLSVVFAGTAGSVPTARRGLPAVLVRRGGDRILFDCGEGTQRQLIRSVGLADIDDVFITHLHVDHWLGLPGMVKSFDLRDRERPLNVFGPPGTRAAIDGLRFVLGRVRFGLHVHELEKFEEVERDGYTVAAVPVRHRTHAYGYALVEPERPGRFDAELAAARGVAPGPDFGRLQRGETVNGVHPHEVIGEPRPGRKIVISGDTAPCDAVRVAAHRADLLIHEATFTEEEADRARDTLHTTARQAAELAAEAEVRLLALTHLSTRYGGREIEDEARAAFPNVVVPRDFDVVEVPFPEKGEPELVRPERVSPASLTERSATPSP
ncbi:MAG TPA: ribonuclease Z [Actinomycetota bacterium]|nr:ribonuclease Z [Actinomycetota bacterium]